jgi:hypothetical protein
MRKSTQKVRRRAGSIPHAFILRMPLYMWHNSLEAPQAWDAAQAWDAPQAWDATHAWAAAHAWEPGTRLTTFEAPESWDVVQPGTRTNSHENRYDHC